VSTNVLFLIIKRTRCTNFSNLFLDWNSTCFGQFHCPSSGIFHCTHSNGISHTGLLTACEQIQNGTAVPFWSCSQAVSKLVWHIPLLCAQWKTPNDGQRKCLKHVEFHSKNKLEKLVHLVGFITRNLTQCMIKWTSKYILGVIVFWHAMSCRVLCWKYLGVSKALAAKTFRNSHTLLFHSTYSLYLMIFK